jgi:hypothetical protein
LPPRGSPVGRSENDLARAGAVSLSAIVR